MHLRQMSAIVTAALMASVGWAYAAETTVAVNRISADGIGAAIGTIILRDSLNGMTVIPDLHDLPPGPHAFHVHENPDCDPGVKDGRKVAGLKAGAHFDPTGVMKGHGDKHAHGKKPHGDLPEITAAADGTATSPVTTDKLSVAAVKGRAIMIHRHGEHEPGKPKGGGERFACGVIPR